MMMPGGGDGDPFAGHMSMVSGLQVQMNPPPLPLATSGVGGGGGGGLQQHQQMRGKDERMPQWSQQETRELIAIRAELERDFTVARRNKTLWEAVAARLRERGYGRSPDQCKCKWKNLFNRYKGKETADPENGRQCPFFEELQAVFTAREKNMQRLLLETDTGIPQSKKKLKRLSGDRSDDEFSEEDEEDEASEEERLPKSRRKKSDPGGSHHQQQQQQRSKATGNTSIHDLLQQFLQQQQRVEMRWHDMVERRAQERRAFELEWRQSMEKLETERLMLEQSWREREEQRRIREESRAEKRDALLTTLLNKLIQDDF